MNPIKRSLSTLVILMLLYLGGCMIDILPFGETFLLRGLSSFYFLILGIALIVYFSYTIGDKRLRRYLLLIAALIVFWLFLRIEKYMVFGGNEFVVRQLWYMFYLPMLMIPQVSFMAALSLDRPKGAGLPAIAYITAALSLLLVLLVLTNDAHQLVFSFRPGFENSNVEYVHESVYWIIALWLYVFMFATVVVLFRTCSLQASKKLIVIPVIYVSLFTVWMLFIAFDVRPCIWGAHPGEFPETACFAMGGFWVLCMSAGLIPSNRAYAKLLSASALAIQVTDKDYRSVYRSPSAKNTTKSQLSAGTQNAPVALSEDVYMYKKEIRGGYAYWQVDFSELNRINKELAELREALSGEIELQRQENEIKEEQARLNARLQLYDNIAVRVLPQSLAIKSASSVSFEKADAALLEKTLQNICIYAAYIKRMSNLMLLASTSQLLSKTELALAMRESLDYLQKAGIITYFDPGEGKSQVYEAREGADSEPEDSAVAGSKLGEGISEGGESAEAEESVAAEGVAATEEELLPARQIINTYESFESLIEQALPALKALSVHMTENEVKLIFEGEVSLSLPAQSKGSIEQDETETFVSLPLKPESRTNDAY